MKPRFHRAERSETPVSSRWGLSSGGDLRTVLAADVHAVDAVHVGQLQRAVLRGGIPAVRLGRVRRGIEASRGLGSPVTGRPARRGSGPAFSGGLAGLPPAG